MEDTFGVNIGVAFSVPEYIRAQVKRLGVEISKRVETVFIVDTVRLIPHITIFQGKIPHYNVARIGPFVEKILKTLHISLAENLFFLQNGLVFWNVEKADELEEAHRLAVEKMLPLTEGLLMKQFEILLLSSETNDREKENITKYGTVLAGDDFLPHITLAKLRSHADQQLLHDVAPTPISFDTQDIMVGKLDEYGQVEEIIAQIKL